MTENTNNKGDLFSITTIVEAAQAIADFKPVVLPVAGGTSVTVNKLPDDKFRELLNRFGEQIAPFIAGEGQRRQLDGNALLELLKQVPGFVDDLLKHATDFHNLEHPNQLPTDVRLVCAAAVLMVSYVDNAATRVFTVAVQRVNSSVAAESEAVASDAQHGTDRS